MSVLDSVANVAAQALSIGAPLAIASAGASFTEASGSLNVGLEGAMLAGAFVASLASPLGWPAAFALSIAAGCAFSAAQEALARWRSADDFVTGIAANLFAAGAIQALARAAYGSDGIARAESLGAAAPFAAIAESIPFFGKAFLVAETPVYLAYLCAIAVAVAFSATPYGLRARCAGSSPESLRLTGLDPVRSRIAAYALSGGSAAFAGALVASSVEAWVPGMTAGYGWIALVMVFLGGKRPAGSILASMAFGIAIALSNVAQGVVAIPAELVVAAPYAFALAGFCAASKSEAVRRGALSAGRGRSRTL